MSASALKMTIDGPVDPTPHAVPANQTAVVNSEALVTPEQRLSASRARIAGILSDWPDLRAQTAEARKASSGLLMIGSSWTLNEVLISAGMPVFCS